MWCWVTWRLLWVGREIMPFSEELSGELLRVTWTGKVWWQISVFSWVWWCLPVFRSRGRRISFEASLSYIVSSRPAGLQNKILSLLYAPKKRRGECERGRARGKRDREHKTNKNKPNVFLRGGPSSVSSQVFQMAASDNCPGEWGNLVWCVQVFSPHLFLVTILELRVGSEEYPCLMP